MTTIRFQGTHGHHPSNIVGGASSGGASAFASIIALFVNDSGADMELGDVVVLKTSGDNLIDVTTSAGDEDVIGVVAEAGPFADGDDVPVVLAGYHASIKVTGAIARGDYIESSTSAGVAHVVPAGPDLGTFARVVADDAGGFAAGIIFDRLLSAGSGGAVVVYDATALTDGAETTFTPPSSFVSGTSRVYLNGLLQRNGVDYTETGTTSIEMTDPPEADDELIIVYGAEGDSVLVFTALADTPGSYAGEANKAVAVKGDETGLEFVDFPAGGSINYSPDHVPASPSAQDDEFDDLSLSGSWTTGSTGAGSTGTIDETLRKGFVRIPVQDGGAGSTRFMYEAYTPGANAFTVAAKVHFDVRQAGSNQAQLYVADSGGTLIYGVGMVNGHLAIFYDSSFGTVDIPYLTSNAGVIYLRITRDATTNFQSWVSADGMTWQRLSGASRSGTVARIYLAAVAFSSSFAEGWWDFVRTFNSQTTDIGGTP